MAHFHHSTVAHHSVPSHHSGASHYSGAGHHSGSTHHSSGYHHHSGSIHNSGGYHHSVNSHSTGNSSSMATSVKPVGHPIKPVGHKINLSNHSYKPILASSKTHGFHLKPVTVNHNNSEVCADLGGDYTTKSGNKISLDSNSCLDIHDFSGRSTNTISFSYNF